MYFLNRIECQLVGQIKAFKHKAGQTPLRKILDYVLFKSTCLPQSSIVSGIESQEAWILICPCHFNVQAQQNSQSKKLSLLPEMKGVMTQKLAIAIGAFVHFFKTKVFALYLFVVYECAIYMYGGQNNNKQKKKLV